MVALVLQYAKLFLYYYVVVIRKISHFIASVMIRSPD